MAKITNTSKWGSAKARERYPCGGMVKKDVGGKVEPLRIPLTDVADRLTRLKGAGILNKEAAEDFAAARMKRLGLDPEKYMGRPARYKSGGKTKLATGGPALGGGRGPFGEKSEEEFIKNSERIRRQKMTEPMGGYAGDSAATAASKEEKR